MNYIYTQKEEMSKNNVAWAKYIKEKNILKHLYSPGYVYITADELKIITHREPRLLAKQDTLAQRPKEFKDHNIGIFPVKNGEYILFRDTTQKSFYKFSESDNDLPVETYNSQVDLNSFDTYPGGQSLSESQAIDFAYISSLLRLFTGKKDLNLVIRGRLFSGKFKFFLPEIKHEVKVNGVQIELDAGYESDDSIFLIEAKIGKRDDFHIRQLFYPYLEWTHNSNKQIIPIFLIYSNNKYYLYQFKFSDVFGDLKIVKSKCYSINESPLVSLNVRDLLARIKTESEPNLPFPQANDMDKVIDLISFLKNESKSKYQIANYFEFDERQGDYYANAARYLGLANKKDTAFEISPIGNRFTNIRSAQERNLFIIQQMLRRPILFKAFQALVNNGFEIDKLSPEIIADIIEEETDLSGSTPLRRASTIRNWLRWIITNSIID